MSIGLNIGDLVLGGRYTLLRQVKGSIGGQQTYLGNKGICRYCGETDPLCFHEIAHTFPEGIGNKWVISLDECDKCNRIFSIYDDALASGVSPFLTLGGVKGKNNKVRQTGRTAGHAVISRKEGAERSQISSVVKDVDVGKVFSRDPATGNIRLKMPVAGVPFRPRFAYKALVKMALALLPDDELPRYEKLRKWVLDPWDTLEFPNLEVAMSFASVGNAPTLAVETLLRRAEPTDMVPYILFILCVGSVCLQIDLMSDHLEDHLPPVPCGSIDIHWSNLIGGNSETRPVIVQYGKPVHLNWSSSKTAPQPIETIVFDFNPLTCEGSFTPIFRGQM